MVFKKGQSGNPAGRRKEDADLKEICRHFTQESVDKLVEWMRSHNAKASVAACGIILDRGWGKAVQALEHSGKDGSPLVPVINFGKKPSE